MQLITLPTRIRDGNPERSRFSGGAKACPERSRRDLARINTTLTAQSAPIPGCENNLTSSLRRLALRTDANEIAEAAVVLPLLFMVLLGIFWFGQAFRIYGTITRAAQEGARAAVAPACSTCAALGSTPPTNAYNAIQNVLVTANLSPSKLQRPATPPSLLSCTGGSAPSCDSTQSSICVQTNIQLSNPATGGTGACGVSVSFRYPYQFWLPFTPLNHQIVKIPAAARVRQETQ